MKSQAKPVALGGILAALAMVIMCLVGLIPIATYICPMLCTIVCSIVLQYAGRKIAWAWYLAVSILSLFLAPDKEAAVMFLFLGYYPIIRPLFCKRIWGWVLKFLYFNISICVLYSIMTFVLGVNVFQEEFAEFGMLSLAILLILGNICFMLLDFLLGRMGKYGRR